MKGQSEQMGPLLSKLPSPPLSTSGGAAGSQSYQPGEQRAAKTANSEANVHVPDLSLGGRCPIDHTILPPFPQGEITS